MNRQRFFDHHSATWDEESHPDLDARLRRVVADASLEAGHRVLDLGAGAGVLIPHLLHVVKLGGRLIAVDLSEPMLRRAQSKHPTANLLLVQADAHHLPLPDNALDRVICNAALPHFENHAESLREMARVLRPGALLIISHPIGRAAVNALHRRAGGPVSMDRVPPPDAMAGLLCDAGLSSITVTDEPDFYLARARKPDPQA